MAGGKSKEKEEDKQEEGAKRTVKYEGPPEFAPRVPQDGEEVDESEPDAEEGPPGEDFSEEERWSAALEGVLDEMGMDDKAFTLKVYKKGPPRYREQDVHTGLVKTINERPFPQIEDIQEEMELEWGGGSYAIKVLDQHGRYVKKGHYVFDIPVERARPKIEAEYLRGSGGGRSMRRPRRDEEWDVEGLPPTRRDMMPRRDDPKVDALQRDVSSLKADIKSLTDSLREGQANRSSDLILTMMQTLSEQNRQSQEARAERDEKSLQAERAREESRREREEKRDDQRRKDEEARLERESQDRRESAERREKELETRLKADKEQFEKLVGMMTGTNEQAFKSASESKDAIMKVLQDQKEDQMKLFEKMSANSSSGMKDVMDTVLGILRQGMDIKDSEPAQSQWLDVGRGVAEGFKALTAGRSTATPAQTAAIAKDAVQAEMQRRKEKPKAGPLRKHPEIPAPAAQDSEGYTQEDYDGFGADAVLGKLIEAMKGHPEETMLLPLVKTLIPPSVVQQCIAEGQQQPLFDYLEQNGDEDLVKEAGALLREPGQAEWLEAAVQKELALGAISAGAAPAAETAPQPVAETAPEAAADPSADPEPPAPGPEEGPEADLDVGVDAEEGGESEADEEQAAE